MWRISSLLRIVAFGLIFFSFDSIVSEIIIGKEKKKAKKVSAFYSCFPFENRKASAIPFLIFCLSFYLVYNLMLISNHNK